LSIFEFVRICISRGPKGDDRFALLSRKLANFVKRLGSYKLLHSTFDTNEWRQFRDCNLLNEIQVLLASGRFANAISLWCRHGMDEQLQEGIHEILGAVPDNIPPSLLLKWLSEDVIPSLRTASDRYVPFT
jgi:hypothetical protein